MPNRIIKESICTSDDINALALFEEVLFYRLIVTCDDYGRMDARTAILRARMFPLRDEVTDDMVDAALARLCALGCVRRYDVDGKPYLCLPSWENHQRVRNQRGKYPPPSAADGGDPRPESESLSESESISEGESEAEAEPAAACGAPDVRAVAAAAASLGMPYKRKDARIAEELVTQYGGEWVMEAMDRAAEGPSRTWQYIRGILRRWQAGGGMDARQRPAAKPVPAKQVLAQQYTQRTYTAEQLAQLVEVI